MKVTYKLLVPAFVAGLLLVGCGQQDVATPAGEMAEEVTEAAGEMVEEAAEAVESASGEPGGYVPTADELIPGETRP